MAQWWNTCLECQEKNKKKRKRRRRNELFSKDLVIIIEELTKQNNINLECLLAVKPARGSLGEISNLWPDVC